MTDKPILNPDSIAERRISLDEAQLKLVKQANFLCHFCNRRFKSELLFYKHHCEAKRKQQELMSPIGQAAYGYYNEWMRQRKFREQSSSAFLASKLYRAFIKFAKMVQSANIATPEKYIQLMVETGVQPPLWIGGDAYTRYIKWMDTINSPLEQTQQSINYLLKICEDEQISLDKVFEHLGSQRVLSLIRQRRLSPWLLFNSDTFVRLLKSLSLDELKAYNLVINSESWAQVFDGKDKEKEEIRGITKELGL